MESFDLSIKEETFRVIRNNADNYSFSVFNYATCHIIEKNNSGVWKAVQHRFGRDSLPLNEIGEGIEKYYNDSL